LRAKTLLALALTLGFVCANPQPRVVVILVHEERTPEELAGAVRHQRAWMLWQSAETPSRALTLSTGLFLQADAEQVALMDSDAPYEHGSARAAFRRRTGIGAPKGSVVALGAGVLVRRGILKHTFASRMERLAKRGGYFRVANSLPPTPYALIAIGSQGYLVPRTYPDAELLRVALFKTPLDWAVIEVNHWDYADWELLIGEGIETWVLCTRPPSNLPSNRLTAVVRYAARERNGLLTSPTTRWSGLIREVDLMASLYFALVGAWDPTLGDGAPAFEGTRSDWHRYWNGLLPRTLVKRVGEQVGVEWQSDALSRIVSFAWVQREIAPMVLGTIAGLGLGWLGAGVVLWLAGRLRGVIRRLFIVGLAVWVLCPAVFMSIAYCPTPIGTGDPRSDSAVVVGWLVGVWFVLAVVAGVLARWKELSMTTTAGIVTVAVILGDVLLAGGYGLNRSLVEQGLVQGKFRYGVDAFWLGVLLTLGTLVPCAYLANRHQGHFTSRGMLGLGAFYGVGILVCGLPLLGANYASWGVLLVGLGLVALYQARVLPETPSWWLVVLAGLGLGGFGVALAWGIRAWDRAQAWQKQAIGIPFLSTEGWGVLLGLGVLGLFLGIVGLLRRLLRHQAIRLWESAIALRWGVVGGIAGGLFALLLMPDGWVVLSLACTGGLIWGLEFFLGLPHPRYPAETNGKAR